jgi:hypothetical protein
MTWTPAGPPIAPALATAAETVLKGAARCAGGWFLSSSFSLGKALPGPAARPAGGPVAALPRAALYFSR